MLNKSDVLNVLKNLEKEVCSDYQQFKVENADDPNAVFAYAYNYTCVILSILSDAQKEINALEDVEI